MEELSSFVDRFVQAERQHSEAEWYLAEAQYERERCWGVASLAENARFQAECDLIDHLKSQA